ncbi:MAG: hypothetical protein Q4E12_00455 [Coriobacteriia bacterium]|nr:hypothetical protein [Coriobacteriia bacterium]
MTTTSHTSSTPGPSNPHEKALGRPISRRVFLSATAVVGALTFKGSLFNGKLEAWADESNEVHFVIYMLSKYEVPIMAYDVSGASPVPLEGVQVTVYSYYTDTSLTVTTDKDGFAPVNVKSLSFEKDDDTASYYNFWGTVAAEKDGWRQFYMGGCWIEGGTPTNEDGTRPNVINVPTQPSTDGLPYLRAFTLDDADIQYTQGNEAPIWAGNTENQVFEAQVATRQAGATAAVNLLVNGAVVNSASASAASTDPYLATVQFADTWLAKLNVGDTIGLQFSVNGGTLYEFTSPLECVDALLISEDGQQNNIMTSVGEQPNSDTEDKYAIMPPWMNREDDSMYLCFPMIPFQIFFDAKGNFGVSADLLQVNFMKERDGKDLLEGKKRVSHFFGKWGVKGWDSYKNQCKQNIQNYEEAYNMEDFPNEQYGGYSHLSTYYNLAFSLSLLGYGTTKIGAETGTLYTEADLALGANFSTSLAFTQEIVIDGLPFFWTFDISFFIRLKLAFGIAFENAFENVVWGDHQPGGLDHWPYAVVVLRFEVGLTLGAGVAGVVSAAIRGYGYIQSEFTFGNPQDFEFYPGIDIKMGCGVQIIAQFLFFKKTVTVAKLDDIHFYSNDPDDDSLLGGAKGENLNGLALDDMTPVSDSNLAGCAEFTGTWVHTGSGAHTPVFVGINPRKTGDVSIAGVRNPYARCEIEGEDADPDYNPINGLVPSVEELLWEGCYSNPRMRIVHTDTADTSSSFANDRCFLVRLAVVDVEVPGTVESFASQAFWRHTADADSEGNLVHRAEKLSFDGKLGVHSYEGNKRVIPSPEVLTVPRGSAQLVTDDNPQTVQRTRLVISEWNHQEMTWGNPNVLDFTVEGEVFESDRVNSFDVDFDVEVNNGTLLLAITSATRPMGEADEHPAEYEKREYVSIVRWDPDTLAPIATGSTHSSNIAGKGLFHPRIMMQYFDAGDGSENLRCLLYSYMCEYNDNGDRSNTSLAVTVFDEMAATEGGSMGDHCIAPPTPILSTSAYHLNADAVATGTFEVACPDRNMKVPNTENNRNQSVAVLSWSRPKSPDMNALSFVVSQTFSMVADTSGSVTKWKPDVQTHSEILLSGVPDVVKLTSLDQQGLFSYADTTQTSDTKPLRMVLFDKESLQLSSVEDTGKTDKIRYFSSFNGRRLYTVRVMEGEGPGLTDHAKELLKDQSTNLHAAEGPYNSPSAAYKSEADYDGSPVQLYQLLEARWVDELQTYYDFYPIAQLSHVPDNIDVVATNDTRTDFTFAYITNIDENKADLYQVAVPKIMAATCSNVNPVSPFAAPGDTCWYTIDVTNVGNAPITLLKMGAYDANEHLIEERTYDDLSPYVQFSCDNVQASFDEEGRLITDENGFAETTVNEDARDTAGILWPGKCRTYKFGFTVPSGFEGDTQFGVRVEACEDHMDDPTVERTAAFRELTSVAEGTIPVITPASYVSPATRNADFATASSEASARLMSEVETGNRAIIDPGKHRFTITSVIDSVIGSQEVTTANYSSSSAGTNTNSGGTNSSSGVKTGDDLRMSMKAAALAALAGATAAGVAAYEKRRAENEGRTEE